MKRKKSKLQPVKQSKVTDNQDISSSAIKKDLDNTISKQDEHDSTTDIADEGLLSTKVSSPTYKIKAPKTEDTTSVECEKGTSCAMPSKFKDKDSIKTVKAHIKKPSEPTDSNSVADEGLLKKADSTKDTAKYSIKDKPVSDNKDTKSTVSVATKQKNSSDNTILSSSGTQQYNSNIPPSNIPPSNIPPSNIPPSNHQHRKPRSKVGFIVVSIVILCVVAGGSFLGGRQYESIIAKQQEEQLKSVKPSYLTDSYIEKQDKILSDYASNLKELAGLLSTRPKSGDKADTAWLTSVTKVVSELSADSATAQTMYTTSTTDTNNNWILFNTSMGVFADTLTYALDSYTQGNISQAEQMIGLANHSLSDSRTVTDFYQDKPELLASVLKSINKIITLK